MSGTTARAIEDGLRILREATEGAVEVSVGHDVLYAGAGGDLKSTHAPSMIRAGWVWNEGYECWEISL